MVIDIKQVKKVNADNGRYFFSPDSMRFFRSRCPKYAYQVGNKAYFVTSEQFDYNSPRRYTVRVCNMATGEIDNISSCFNELSYRQAQIELSKLSKDNG